MATPEQKSVDTPEYYKIGLGSQTLSRARNIFGILLLVTLFFFLAGIHQGVQSGDFYRIFVQPFQQFGTDLDKALFATPTPRPTLSATPTVLPTPSPAQTTTVKPPTQQPVQAPSNCIRKNIREGEFASNKCYAQQDYEDLEYYLGRYNSAVFDLRSAENGMKITCNCRNDQECAFFKDSCEEDKQQKGQAESDIEKYKGIVHGIIAKGK